MSLRAALLPSLAVLALALFPPVVDCVAGDIASLVIVREVGSSARVKTAAAELRRYVYLRTGSLCTIGNPAAASVDRIVLAHDGHLEAEQFVIRTEVRAGSQRVKIAGGSDLGVLYGVYRYIEKLGVRFYLHGDVIPDERLGSLPVVNEDGKPLFAIRGILPFHDFFEGPDWWNLDDYKSYAVQMARMRMNFLGLHNYPERQEGYPGPEPSVWIGLPEDVDRQGLVKFSYPGFFANTMRPGWGNVPMKTSQYVGGAAELFEHDAYGPETQIGHCPWPTNSADCNTVFNRTAAMYREAFTLARGLGIKTCVGTETPLTLPQSVQERLKAHGKDPAEPAVVREIYEGIFQRISRAFPVDYYWLWTPEDWTWGGNKPGQFEATACDVKAALGALEQLGHPLTLAMCGWVLGPQQDRAALAKLLPQESPLSCINQKVGHAPVEGSFAKIQGRPKWAIPWLENDPNMTGPQPWVGRMFYDGADALRYGCTGLLGIHWRTKVIGMNIAALAQAGWSIPEGWQPVKTPVGALGGFVTNYAAAISGTEESPVYQTVRYQSDGYQLGIPNGTYMVTLKLVEPEHAATGRRVFGITLQGQTVVDRLDVFENAGKDQALDLNFPDVRVVDGWLNLRFIRITNVTCISGIVIQGMTDAVNQVPAQPYSRKINCGGPAWKDYEADQVAEGADRAGEDRSLGAFGFYQDWASANFGKSAGPALGAFFAKLDGKGFPEISQWGGGPGRVKVINTAWALESKRFDFVAEAESLRSLIKGAGNLERFDYWLNTFRYARAMAQFGCAVGELNRIMRGPAVDRDRTLTLRQELTTLWTALIRWQMAAVDTPGELGTIANLEQQSRGAAKLLNKHDLALEKLIGAPLPATCRPSTTYAGPPRLIVPTVRSLVKPGEMLKLKVILLAREPVKSIALKVRPLGTSEWQTSPVMHVSRAVYMANLPAAQNDFEYHLTAETTAGQQLIWPATAPTMNQTVVLSEL